MSLFQPQEPTYDESPVAAQERRTQQRMIGVLIVVGGMLALIALAVWASGIQNSQSSLFPRLPSPTPASRIISSVATSVTFAELNDNPAAYLNRVIQATGDYTPLEVPDCRPFAGPRIEWSLVGDSLQLNAKGYENILRLAEPGMEMTVVGVWRLYDGPVGCGKEPPDDVVWYLDVSRIIEPNPLFGGPEGVLTFVPGDVVTAESIRPTLESTPELAPTAVFATSESSDPSEFVTMTPEGVVTEIPTATELPLTPLPTSGSQLTPSPTVTGTPDPNASPSATVDPNASPTATPTGGATSTLPTNTPTSGGYPVASPTVGGYP